MKCFKPIKDKKQLKAICRALNKLFWKVPPVPLYTSNNGVVSFSSYSTDDSAEFWVAELYDAGIEGIKWNKKISCFEVE